jgi:phospholipase C
MNNLIIRFIQNGMKDLLTIHPSRNYEGGSFLDATQCMVAGDNGWQDNHAALNGGLNNHWATNNTPWSWGHFKRSDIPVQYSIADAWTVGDMYQVCL